MQPASGFNLSLLALHPANIWEIGTYSPHPCRLRYQYRFPLMMRPPDASGGQIVLLGRHPFKTSVQTCGCLVGEVLVDIASPDRQRSHILSGWTPWPCADIASRSRYGKFFFVCNGPSFMMILDIHTVWTGKTRFDLTTKSDLMRYVSAII